MTDALNAINATRPELDGVERDMNTLGAVGEVRPKRGSRASRPSWHARGWLSPREYSEATAAPLRSVQRWCRDGSLTTIAHDGHDWRIAVATLHELHPSLRPAA